MINASRAEAQCAFVAKPTEMLPMQLNAISPNQKRGKILFFLWGGGCIFASNLFGTLKNINSLVF
jgi:hypothetical protein